MLEKFLSNESGRVMSEVVAKLIVTWVTCAAIWGFMTSDYTSLRDKLPTIFQTNNGVKIRASHDLSGYFPLRGFDYDKDGNLDKVEQLLHGYPRIAFGHWRDVSKDSVLFQKLEEEYDNNREA